MFKQSYSWLKNLFPAIIVTSLFLPETLSATDLDNIWVVKTLKTEHSDFASFKVRACCELTSFVNTRVKIEEEREKLSKKDCSDKKSERDFLKYEANTWAQFEQTQTHPMLKAVCCNLQYHHVRDPQKKIDLLERTVKELVKTSKAFASNPELSLKVKIFAAREAGEIAILTDANDFVWPTALDKIGRFTRHLTRPAKLWEEIAAQSKHSTLADFMRYRQLPTYQVNEERTTDLYILEECGLRCIENPAPLNDHKYNWETADKFKSRMDASAKLEKKIKIAFKALCYLRANNFRTEHFRLATRRNNPLPYVKSEEDDFAHQVKIARKAAKNIAALAKRQESSEAKFFLCSSAAEIRAWPIRMLKSDYADKFECRMNTKTAEIAEQERKAAKHFLQEMYNQVIDNSKDVASSRSNRLRIVRAYHNLAMLTTNSEKRRELLMKALPLCELKDNESANDPLVDRYNYGDIQIGLTFPTWKQAIDYRFQELYESKKK
jgi:hypothetical protein